MAPIATPETLSEESVTGSKTNLTKQARLIPWRMQRAAPAAGHRKGDSPPGLSAVEPAHSSWSDVCEMTESSSAYCASPLSGVRAAGRSSRAQLKREIMRLYQRAAADVDRVELAFNSASSSSPSQPSGSFPVADQMSPVFGVPRHKSPSLAAESSRPATANGAQTDQSAAVHRLPPCNTSF